MTNNLNHPFLQFDFSTEDGANQAPLLFSNPLNIITTHTYDMVPDCLEQIEQAVLDGHYVAGYFSYELAYVFSQNTELHHVKNQLPLLWFGVFKNPTDERHTTNNQKDFHVGNWKMQTSKQAYQDNFHKIMEAIKNNQTKQINYTVPFQASFSGSAYHYYKQLKEAQKSHYSAYLQMDQQAILSASPELFFHVKNDEITVRPMKGTAKRGLTSEADIMQKKFLQQSEKNRLENTLITALMRKELEKVTKNNSTQIIDEFRVEKYPTVYQMTTGIRGKVKEELSIVDIIKALFPCGSISGVPKPFSLQLIKDIEDTPREVYCGAIGYITPNKEAIFNVPIRTVWIDHLQQKAFYGAGGAITKNSNMQDEYEEVLTKTDILTWKSPSFKLLETMAIHDGKLFLLEEHLHRLRTSASYFDIPMNIAAIRQSIIDVAHQYPKNRWRLRLTVNQEGKEEISIRPLEHVATKRVILAKEPINKNHLYVYHKTTNRLCYEEHQVKDESILDVLLWNDKQELTEFTIGNIVVEWKGELVTPPVSSGLLAGTFRNQLLNNGEIKEKIITKNNIRQCKNIWLINSVRQWVKVELV